MSLADIFGCPRSLETSGAPFTLAVPPCNLDFDKEMQAFDVIDIFDQRLQQQLLQGGPSHSRLPGRQLQRTSFHSGGSFVAAPPNFTSNHSEQHSSRVPLVAQAPSELCFAMEELDCFSDRFAAPLQQQRLQELHRACLSSSFLLKSECEWSCKSSCGRSLALSRNSKSWGTTSEAKRRCVFLRPPPVVSDLRLSLCKACHPPLLLSLHLKCCCRRGAVSALGIAPLLREAWGRRWPSRPLRSLDLPGALHQRLPLRQMDWSRRTCCLATVLLGAVYAAATDASCSPVAEPLALRVPLLGEPRAAQLSALQQQRLSSAVPPSPQAAAREDSFSSRPGGQGFLEASLGARNSAPPAAGTASAEEVFRAIGAAADTLQWRSSLTSPGEVFSRSVQPGRRAPPPPPLSGIAPPAPSAFQSPRAPAESFPARRWVFGHLEGTDLDAAPSREIPSLCAGRRVTCLHYALVDEGLLALGFDGGAIEVWRVEATAAPSRLHEGLCSRANPLRSRRLAVAERDASCSSCSCADMGLLQVQSLTQGLEALKRRRSGSGSSGGDCVSALAWHPRELLFAAAHSEGFVSLWRLHASEASALDGEARLEREHCFLFAAPLQQQPALCTPAYNADELAVQVESPASLAWNDQGSLLAVGSRDGGLALFSYSALLSFKAEAKRLQTAPPPEPQPPAASQQKGEERASWTSPPRPLLFPASPLAFLGGAQPGKAAALAGHSLAAKNDSLLAAAEGEDDAEALAQRAEGEGRRSRLATVSCASTQPGASPPETPVGAALSRDEGSLAGCEAATAPDGSSAAAPVPPSGGAQTELEQRRCTAAAEALEMHVETQEAEASELQRLQERLEFVQRQLLALRVKSRLQLLKAFLPFPAASWLLLSSAASTALSAVGNEQPVRVSGAWLLGVQSVTRGCHGGPVWCESFCPPDARVLLSAGDEQPLCGESCCCSRGTGGEAGKCSVKAWLVVEGGGLSGAPLFQVDMEGSVRRPLSARPRQTAAAELERRRPPRGSACVPLSAPVVRLGDFAAVVESDGRTPSGPRLQTPLRVAPRRRGRVCSGDGEAEAASRAWRRGLRRRECLEVLARRRARAAAPTARSRF